MADLGWTEYESRTEAADCVQGFLDVLRAKGAM